MSLRACLLGLSALLALAPAATSAGGTRTFRLDDFDDFDDGEADGAAIEGSGKVSVGFLAARGDVLAATSVFTCAADLRDKSSGYLGTADAAAIHRVKVLAGKKGPEPKAERLAELPGAVVSALAQLPGGDLVAATLPGGKIHRIDAKGKVSEFAALKVEQIWALVPHEGRLLVGTGPKGELLSLDLQGKDLKVLLDSDEKDILAVLPVGKDVVVGTSPGAKVLQVNSGLEGNLLHDFSGDEVRALALVERGLVAAVNDFSDRGLSSLQALTKTLNRTSLVGQPPEGSVDASAPSAPSASADLWFVDLGPRRDLARAAEATWDTWLHRDKQFFTALLAGEGKAAGEVLVASSHQGKVYRVRGRRDVAAVADFEERQATSLCRLGDGAVLAAAGDGAAVYRLAAAPASKALYRTEVLDAKQPATFGAVYLRGDGELGLRARVGPSDEADKRWSEWKSVPLKRDGDALAGALSVPVRRYVELEVSLAPGAELRDLQLFYAPENLAPLVSAVDVARPDFDLDDNDEPDGKLTIKWKADARDDDDLVYEVRVRPEGGDDKQWISLNGAEPVTKKEYKWDLASVPDGVYEAQVIASDEPANGVTRAAHDEVTSAPFVIDHKRPALENLKVSGRTITGTATDEGGYIHDVAFSVDGGPFRAASPVDGLFDTGRESFSLTLPDALTPGRHRVVVRARDSFGNLGSQALVTDK